jgi:phage tail-like protein
MRGTLERLETPFALGAAMPALYQEDPFAQRLTGAFDTLLAPAIASLDNFQAYLDPGLAPEDFVELLAAWVGVGYDETWPVERRRALVASASELYRLRGTVQGLRAHVAIFTGGDVDVEESGGAGWSPRPGAPLPGSAELKLHVRVHLDDPSTTSEARLDALVASAKPAHVPHTVEIVASSSSKRSGGGKA